MQSIRDWMESESRSRQGCAPAKTSLTSSSASPILRPRTKRSAARACNSCRAARSRSTRAHAYGTPFFIQADLPIANEKAATKIRSPRRGAGYRLGHCRAGGGPTFISAPVTKRRASPPHQESRPVRHAAAARARSCGSRPRYAAAAGAAGNVQLQFQRHGGSHRDRRRAAAGSEARNCNRRPRQNRKRGRKNEPPPAIER